MIFKFLYLITLLSLNRESFSYELLKKVRLKNNERTLGGINQQEKIYKSCGDDKFCVPFYLCNNKAGHINNNGFNIIDVRYDQDKPCLEYLEQCCAIEDSMKDVNLPKSILYKNGCGYRNADGLLFKITGNKDGETEYAEFPWMIAVLKQENFGDNILSIYQCGGSLIHPSVVLTAAHCVVKNEAQDLIVRAGEWDTQTKDEVFDEQDREVHEIIIHEHFSRDSLHNNIALLFTFTPFVLEPHINTVCLPASHINFDFTRCFATGWGKDAFGQNGRYQAILKKIELPVVPFKKCQRALRRTRLGPFFKLNESFLCAGGELGKDTCRGDGGGPLSCPIPGSKDRFHQIGIVSWGIGCGDLNPGVYANIAFMRSWVDKIFNLKNLTQDYYIPSYE